MKKILIVIAIVSAALFQACTREGVPSGEMTSEQLKQNPGAAEYMTLGNYAMFKEPMAYMGEEKEWPEAKNTYIRHFLFMTEFRGDNFALCYLTSDDLRHAATYSDTPSLRNNTYMWWIAYRIIYGANAVIESLNEGVSDEFDHIKGENYFLRAVCHLHLVNLFAKPYSLGANNPGIIIRNSTDTSVTERATVGQVYAQIEEDLKEAARLMGKSSRPRMGDNRGYASRQAALGLLSRVYLYTGRNADVIKLVTEDMLAGGDASAQLEPDISNYFANTLSSRETLWAVGHTSSDLGDTPTSKLASMYYTDDNGVGWGEVLWSDPLIDLFSRYPDDKRFTSYCVTRLPRNASEGDKQIRYVDMNGTVGLPITQPAIWDDTESKYYFEDGSQKVWLETETVKGYPAYYITLNGVKTTARIGPATTLTSHNNFPQYFMTKFSFQDGISMLASPPMIRWGEVILNRAEAYAKEGDDEKALADVNTLRRRAGLPDEAMFTTANYASRGYSSVLDVVLDERRMELCFEGHRAIDQFRNGKSLDRRYAGAQDWEVIQPDDPRFVFKIPADEIRVSGIPQND